MSSTFVDAMSLVKLRGKNEYLSPPFQTWSRNVSGINPVISPLDGTHGYEGGNYR